MNERKRANLYRSVARMLAAGLPPAQLHELLGAGFEHSRNSWMRRAVSLLRAGSQASLPLSEAMAAGPADLFPLHHRSAVRAAEISGQVPRVLNALADDEERKHGARVELIRRSIYPIILLQVAVIGPNAGLAFTDPSGFVLHIMTLLLPIDLALFLAAHILLSSRPGPVDDYVSLRLPLLREFSLNRDYGIFFSAMGNLYEAGVALPAAADEALPAVRNRRLRDQLGVALTPLREHGPLSAAVPSFPHLDDLVASTLITSEPSGELGSGLKRAAAQCEENENLARDRLIRVAIGVLLTFAFLYAAVRILAFWSGYFDMLRSI
ncbi:MAG: type II secretion system F family protein [Planctomycetota bacterium]